MSEPTEKTSQDVAPPPRSRWKTLGPGLIVMAAFMGPGSVTTASVAGANFGFVVLWSVVFATVATIILQEMTARLGIVSRLGLGDALRQAFANPVWKAIAAVLVLLAIAVGGFSFETGNVTGASQGLTILTGIPSQVTAVVAGIIVFALLFIGRYKIVERTLVVLVALMSVVFLLTAVLVRPDVGEMLRGLVVPSVPAGSLITLVGLIGSTVVPYNLFLHSASVQEKWPTTVPTKQALSESRVDTSVSITLGGLITAAILATGAAAFFQHGDTVEDAVDMARQLEPTLGTAAEFLFGLGFMAAGLTSAITAPLGAAYALTGVLGWGRDMRSWRFRAVWMTVVAVGTLFAVLGTAPIAVILITQYAAGLTLPVLAIFLIIVMNRRAMLREHTNGVLANVLGVIVVAGVVTLGILQLFGIG
ncbi:MAG: divalent metal cation transporter [Streptosporangiales bacterium]|nr:divalent metal cation transporter [Streptosporangiales bacterium]